MSGISGAVGRGFRNLFVFSGRDTPAQFWPFAGVVLVASFIVGNVLFVVVVSLAIAAEPGFAQMTSELAFPGIEPLVLELACVALFTACLLAAAVTRRLHDRNHRGGWAGVPLAFLGAGLVLFMFEAKGLERDPDPDPTLFFVILANNVVYFVTLALLVWQLVKSGTDGENRFGATT